VETASMIAGATACARHFGDPHAAPC
jgi:hypothetical protein